MAMLLLERSGDDLLEGLLKDWSWPSSRLHQPRLIFDFLIFPLLTLSLCIAVRKILLFLRRIFRLQAHIRFLFLTILICVCRCRFPTPKSISVISVISGELLVVARFATPCLRG